MNIATISQLKQQTTKLVNQVSDDQQPLTITQRSKAKAVLVDYDYFSALEQAAMDATDAREATQAKTESTVSLDDYEQTRWGA